MIKNKKRGFTLTEILLTLGIIGVIAALTIPQIVNYTMKSKIEGNLARAVEQIELGCQNLIQYTNDNISDGSFVNGFKELYTDNNGMLYTEGANGREPLEVSGNMFNKYAPFYNLIFIGSSTTGDTNEYTNYKNEIKTKNEGASSIVTTIDRYFIGLWKMKNSEAITSINYAFGWPSEDNVPGYFPIFLDANGTKKPNNYGKDIFFFGLTDSCKMIPAGSQRFVNDYPLYGEQIPLATTSCSDSGITNGLSCTSRVVADGFKINYW